MNDKINKDEVLLAFAKMGEAIRGYDEIEIVLVGGMAGRLGGWLDPLETTKDCDAMVYVPEQMHGYVEQEAANIGRGLGLPPNWLNSTCRIFEWALPEGWNQRKHKLGTFGLLTVFYVDRIDLIALKVIASRDVDRVHLLAMKVTQADLDFVEKYLAKLKGHPGMDAQRQEAVDDTLEILRSQL